MWDFSSSAIESGRSPLSIPWVRNSAPLPSRSIHGESHVLHHDRTRRGQEPWSSGTVRAELGHDEVSSLQLLSRETRV